MDIATLHLTSNQLCSRVILNVDGETYSAEVFGNGHQDAARDFSIKVRDALKHGKACAINLIA